MIMRMEITDLIKRINIAVFITALIVLLFDSILANKFSLQKTVNTKLTSNILLTDEAKLSSDNIVANKYKYSKSKYIVNRIGNNRNK